MSSETERLESQLRRVFEGGAWHGPSVLEAYTAHTQFIGITQHDLYHAGQIAILRKAGR